MEVVDGNPIPSNSAWVAKLVEIFQPVSTRARMLGSMALFAGVSWPDLEAAAALFAEVELPRGARLTVQGRSEARLWLLVAGEALVSADARPLRVIGHGEAAGVAAMLYAVRSRETTMALSPVRALTAGKVGFEQLVRLDQVRRRLTAVAGEQIRARRESRAR
jgi:CRP-like cAMP-binding protein